MASTEDQPLTKQTLAGFKWSGLSTIIQGILQFSIFTTLAHLLTPREFGIVGMATIFTNLIERVGFLGVGQALVQRETLTQAHIRSGFALCVSFGLLLFATFYFASPNIAAYFEEPLLVPVLRVISLGFVFAAIAEVPLCLLQRNLKFKRLLVVTNTSYLVGSGIIGITLAVFGFSYWALVASVVTGRLVRLILAFRAVPQRLTTDFSRTETKELLSTGIGFSLGRLWNYCALVGDNFVIGKLLGAHALGLYGRAYQLMTAPATYFGQILEKVLFAALSQRQNDRKKVGKYFLYGVELCCIVSVGGALLLSVAAPEVVVVLFGPQWLEAVPAIQILAFGVVFRTCYKNSDTVIRALGAVYSLAIRQILYAVIVVGGAIFGSRWGIQGVSFAVLFAVFLNYVVLSFLCLRLLSLPLRAFGRAHLPAIWVGVWQFLALEASFQAFRAAGWNSFLSLGCGLAILGITSLLALGLCPKSICPKVFSWLSANLNLARFGIVGRLGNYILLRGA